MLIVWAESSQNTYGIFYTHTVENGPIYKVVLAQFISLHCTIGVSIVLHKKNPCFLCTDCFRLRYVCNQQDWPYIFGIRVNPYQVLNIRTVALTFMTKI